MSTISSSSGFMFAVSEFEGHACIQMNQLSYTVCHFHLNTGGISSYLAPFPLHRVNSQPFPNIAHSYQWSQKWQHLKRKSMLISNSQPTELHYHAPEQLTASNKCKYLGVKIISKLSWNDHTATKHLGFSTY